MTNSVLYVMQFGNKPRYLRIGVTNHLARKMKEVLASVPMDISYILYLECEDTMHAKRLLHWFQEFMRSRWIRGEWYDAGGDGPDLLAQAKYVLDVGSDNRWQKIDDVEGYFRDGCSK